MAAEQISEHLTLETLQNLVLYQLLLENPELLDNFVADAKTKKRIRALLLKIDKHLQQLTGVPLEQVVAAQEKVVP